MFPVVTSSLRVIGLYQKQQRDMLLDRVLSANEMRKIVKDNQENLKTFVSKYGEKVTMERPDLSHIENLKKNYQTLISILSEQSNPEVNNFSLHFIATISSGYIKFNRIDEAKEILKKSQVYLQGTNTNPLLLVVCLNNLANIQKIKEKHYKSLRISLKALEVMTTHMQYLRLKKDKQKLREDAVVFLIVIIRCKLTLATILNKNQHKYFRKAYQLMNYLGYRSCLRYLGKQSIFIKRFTPVEKEYHLPLFKTQQKIQKKPQNDNEKLILQQLNKIHDVLKSRQNPDIIVMNTQQNIPESRIEINQTQNSIIVNQISPASDLPKIPKAEKRSPPKKEEKAPDIVVQQKNISIEQELIKIESEVKQAQPLQQSQQPTPQYIPSQTEEEEEEQEAVIAQQTIFIDKWEIKIKLEREKNQTLGTLMFESWRMSTNKNKKQRKQIVLSDDRLEKIINQINFQDLMPYQYFNQQLNEEEFLSYNIKPFLDINDKEGSVSIHPKAKGLLAPFTMKLFSQESLIFFNHVRTNLFRASISPVFSSKSIYLNIQFSPDSMLAFFTFEEEVNDFFTAIFKSIQNVESSGSPTEIKDKTKTCRLVDQLKLKEYLREILIQFQSHIINREDETSINEILDNQLFYYKYREIDNNKKGMYYLIRYLPGINCFDIYLKNNYQTYGPDSQLKARGNILYRYQDFFMDFGVPLKCSFSKRKLFAYLQIIAKKYTLMTFDSPLSNSQQDAYLENALMEFPITESCFKTAIYQKNEYCCGLTISLLTINNEFPVGIKVNEYNPEDVISRGFFIHIVPQEWVRPLRRPCPWVNNILFKTFINEFDFRRNYFIAEWLERKGFDLLFDKILDPSHSLYLQNNINRFIRGKSVIDIFNQTSKPSS